MIMTDLFTRWTVILPLHDTSAAEIAKAIVNVLFLYGPPQKMPINQGKELVYQVSICGASCFLMYPRKNYVFPYIKVDLEIMWDKIFSSVEKKKVAMYRE